MIKLIHGDCLKELPKLVDEGIKVDLVLTDPPFDATLCEWDNIIPFDEMLIYLPKDFCKMDA